jgi:hypothetical protein
MLTTWVNKLKLEVIEEHEDGGCCIHIEWDDTDPDLAEWTSWGPQVQEQFVLDALTDAMNNVSTTEHHVI